MATKLLIVESPGKVKKLSQILGSDWLVRASMGHIRELANDGIDSLGFDLEGNSVRCRFMARGSQGKETIQKLRSAVKQVKTVVLATDYDREGETIAWHLQQALNLKNPQRVVYTEITPNAVRQAVSQPRSIDLNLVHSGLCRSVLDKLVGFRGSPLLWQLHNGAKSMGRVQSATLHLICQRERQIQAFVPQDYWSVFVDYGEGFRAFFQEIAEASQLANPSRSEVRSEPSLTSASDRSRATPTAEAEPPDDAAPPEAQTPESKRVSSQTEADRLVTLAQQHPHQIVTIEGKIVSRTPPPPFVTSTLQQAAGSRLRFSPDQTMQVAQSLYEAGLITYMRTDSVSLSPEFCQQARQWLETHDPENLPQKSTQHRKLKGAQEAHEAIRPTDLFRPSQELRQELNADAFGLYVLIWKRAMASQCQAARIRQTRIVTRSGSVLWQAKGQVIEFLGYSKYWHNLSGDRVLPSLVPGQSLTLLQAAHEPKQTQPPPRYSEPKLVQVMERQGIGRPSTYAPTIKTLKQRSYVEVIKGQLQPTPLGLEVDRFLQDALPELLEAEFTAQMEQVLDQIAAGQQNWQTYLTTWNREYFEPALRKAQQVIPQYLSAHPPTLHHAAADLDRSSATSQNSAVGSLESGHSESGYSESGYSESGYSESGYSESGYSESGYSELDSPPVAKSLTANARKNTQGKTRSNTTRSNTTRSNTTRSNTTRSNTTRSNTTRSNTTRSNTTRSSPLQTTPQLNLSRSRCPQCDNFLAKIPSSKVKKKYFLKCVSGCADLVLFWSEYSRQWEPPRSKTTAATNPDLPAPQLTEHLCPICQQPLECYTYEKAGEQKQLLRCSDPNARRNSNHQQVVYFHTAGGWWSPKFGNL